MATQPKILVGFNNSTPSKDGGLKHCRHSYTKYVPYIQGMDKINAEPIVEVQFVLWSEYQMLELYHKGQDYISSLINVSLKTTFNKTFKSNSNQKLSQNLYFIQICQTMVEITKKNSQDLF